METIQPHVIVLFGATGDLSRRKLLPGLAHLALSALAPDIQVIGTSLEDMTEDEFRNFAKEAVKEFSHHPLTDEHWNSFAERLTYIPQSAGPKGLSKMVRIAEEKLGGVVGRLHYMSVPPAAAPKVINTLREANLVERSRVVMEKPFGTDLQSAITLNDQVHETFRSGRSSDRPLPGQGSGAEHPCVPLRQRVVRADLEPELHRPHPDRHPRDVGSGQAREFLRGDRRL
jgi:glucose-6-phosphate 1-dehydrogenase